MSLPRGACLLQRRRLLTTDQLRMEALFLGFRTKRGVNLGDFLGRQFSQDLLVEKAKNPKKAREERVWWRSGMDSAAHARGDGRRRQSGVDLKLRRKAYRLTRIFRRR